MSILPRRAILASGGYIRPPFLRQGKIWLDMGENIAGFPDVFPDGLNESVITTYPEYEKLYEALSELYGLPPSHLFVSNGSDEALNVIAHTFIESGEDAAVVSSPCFFVIDRALEMAGARMLRVRVKADLSFDLDGLGEAIASGAKLVMLATPDNPTGAVLERGVIEGWLSKYPETLFVIDEAYFDFSGCTVIDLIEKCENLLVTRTFSKAWGLAGLRLGVVLGQPELLGHLRKVTLPYNVNGVACKLAIDLIKNRQTVEIATRTSVSVRNRVVAELGDRGFDVINGHANFFLLGAGIDAVPLTSFLREEGILVRNCPGSSRTDLLFGRVKVCTGSDAEMKEFLAAIDRYRDCTGLAFDLDGTLIDTTGSFDVAVHEVVQEYTGQPPADGEVDALEEQGGFNDTWDKAHAIIVRRGIEVTREAVVRRGQEIYLKIAPTAERLLIEMDLLKQLSLRYKLFVVTGRTRCEFDRTWSEKLNCCFEQIYCRDDVPGLLPKPSPDYMLHMLKTHKLKSAVYVGNTVDDMWSARDAGMRGLGVSSVHSQALLSEAGALDVLASVNELNEIVQLPRILTAKADRLAR